MLYEVITVANAQKPFVAIVGGAKVSGKLEVLKSLISKVDTILIVITSYSIHYTKLYD